MQITFIVDQETTDEKPEGWFHLDEPAEKAAGELADMEERVEAGRMGDKRFGGWLKNFVKRAPAVIDGRVAYGWWLLRQDRAEAARNEFRRGVETGTAQMPPNYRGLVEWIHWENRPFLSAVAGLAEAEHALERHAAAAAEFARLLRWNPNDNQGARFYIGSEHLRCGEIDAARRELEHAADIYPPCLFDLGLLHFQQGEHARAATWLRRGFAANPYVGQMLWAEHEWGGVETPRALRVWLGTNLREADTATEYVQRYWRLWLTTANALDFGHWLENEPEVMRERARGLELDRALLWEHEIEARRRIIAERGEFREGIDDTLSERLISLRTTSDGTKVQPWMYPEYRDGEPQY